MNILEIPPVPDGIFWYSLSTVMAGALIAILWNYAKETTGMIKELKETVQNLAINDKVQDEKIDGLDDKVNGYIVNYTRAKRG